MATVASMAATADIAGSLTMEEIPIKLRCAACNKLAVNAFRLPCCEQSICENCQASLPEACPVCAHEPVKAELCKPNKALRTTIKVFLRTEEKKRETQKSKEQAELAPHTPVIPVAVEGPVADGTLKNEDIKTGNAEDNVYDEPPNTNPVGRGPSPNIGGPAAVEAQMDIPRPSVEVTSKDEQFDQSKESTAGPGTVTGNSAADGDFVNMDSKPIGEEQQAIAVPEQQGLSVQWRSRQAPMQGQSFTGNFGFDGTSIGFPSLGSYPQGDFNQLMQFMPNGMSNTGLGGFPTMMGMSGMGLDPMAMSQGMYGGFGGQGMGMNGMNMGMGFGAGQGAYGGFNGQAATWNGGQDKFNPNAFGGLANGMDGDFGANAGYGGYNMPPHQGNYGQMHHQQYQHNNFQNGFNGQGYNQSGRGRGRGYGYTGRGRGGYGPAMQGNQGKHEKTYEPFHHQLPSQLLPQTLSEQEQPNPGVASGGKDNEADTKKTESPTIDQELNPGGEGDGDGADAPAADAKESGKPEGDVIVHTTAETPVLDAGSEATHPAEDAKPAPIETLVSADRDEPDTFPAQLDDEAAVSPMTMMPPPSVPAAPLGPAALYRKDSSQDYAGRGRGGGRGYYRGGPELRGGFRGRGGGFTANGTGAPSAANGQSIPTADFPGVVPVEPKGLGVEGAPTAPKALREGLPNTGIRGGRGFSIVGRASVAGQGRLNGSRRSRSASPSRRRSESRSRSPSRRRSRHHRRHRHRSPSTSSHDSERERRRERRHRRSRKYDDEDDTNTREGKEERSRNASVDSTSKRASQSNHPDKDKERRSSHKHRSSHRSHRDRSLSRSRSRDHRHRRKRSRSPSETPDGTKQENHAKDHLPPTSPSSSRRKDKDREKDYPSSKYRDRDRDRDRDENHRERKRSRRDRSVSLQEEDSDHSRHHRSSRRSRHDDDGRDRNGSSRLHRDRDRDRNPDENTNKDNPQIKPTPAPPTAPRRSSHHAIPTGPKKLQSQPQPHQHAFKQPEREKEREKEKGKEKEREKEKDPHTLEREARNRERLLKEQQRREAVLAEKSGGRRSGAAGGRRMSYKYEDEEGEEGRAKRVRRVEVERERGRWG